MNEPIRHTPPESNAGGLQSSLRPRDGESASAAHALDLHKIDILWHTANRAAMGLYCGGGPDMESLVEAGLMVYAGRKSFVPDPYYRITSKGRAALKAAKWKGAESPHPLSGYKDTSCGACGSTDFEE